PSHPRGRRWPPRYCHCPACGGPGCDSPSSPASQRERSRGGSRRPAGRALSAWGRPYGRLNYRSRGLALSPLSAITFLLLPGQFEGALTSGLGTAVHQYPAAVGAGDLLHEVEADPHADQVPVGVRFDAGEALKELSLILGLDPEPVIEDADAPVGISLGQADVDPPGGAWPKADGIVQQLAKGQVQPVGVAVDDGVGGIEAKFDRQVAKAALMIFDHGFHESDQVDRLSCHRGAKFVEAADQA